MRTWVLVLRNTKTGKTFIWEEDKVLRVIHRAYTYWRSLQSNDWSREADDYLLAEYGKGRFTRYQIAQTLSEILCRKITVNALIGRYHRIHNTRPCERNYTHPVSYMQDQPDA